MPAETGRVVPNVIHQSPYGVVVTVPLHNEIGEPSAGKIKIPKNMDAE